MPSPHVEKTPMDARADASDPAPAATMVSAGDVPNAEEDTAVASDTGMLDNNDDEEACDPSFFEEEAECAALLARAAELLPPTNKQLLPSVGQDPNGVAAMLEDRFAKIVDRYQNSPHLLYPYLEMLIQPLVDLLLRYLPNAAEVWAREAGSGAGESPTAAAGAGEALTSSTVAGAASAPPASAAATQTLVVASALGQDLTMFDADAPKTPLHVVCKALYSVVKTAGEKCCTSHFPNNVGHYEDVFYTLQLWVADATRQREWEVRYCLLLWLSNLVLVPFSLALVDTNSAEEGGGSAAVRRLPLSDATLVTASRFLADTSKCREAAALLVARLLTRPDSARHRGLFFDFANFILESTSPTATVGAGGAATVVPPGAPWAFLAEGTQNTFSSLLSQPFLLPGVLLAIAKTMKLGRREELVGFAPRLLACVAAVFEQHLNDSLLCKTATKVGQRLVLSMLKRRRAEWRYSRHIASLSANLGVAAAEGAAQLSARQEEEAGRDAVDEDKIDGLDGDEESLETGIGLLLQAVGHKDTVVRWSAAKGIGRVCERLPAVFAEEVMGEVLKVFRNAYSDAHWHGGLLTIAELCRRGLVGTALLSKVVPLVAEGLTYDLSRGTYSVGAHVRDAACYTCWSVARAYDAEDLVIHVRQLSVALVVTALFDREVNVRRAAAAAFQECVGRLGNFEHGIELVTAVDFFSLASLRHAYTVVAPVIAQYDTYRDGMLRELVGAKLLHWDRNVRQMAAIALGLVAIREPAATILEEVLPELLRRVEDTTVATRHGAILAIAELIRNLTPSAWSEGHIVQFIGMLATLEGSRGFSARGGTHIRQACCVMLQAIAGQSLPLPNTVEVRRVGGRVDKVRTLAVVFAFLKDSWDNILDWVQHAAADTFCAVAQTYFVKFLPSFHGKVLMEVYEGCLPAQRVLSRRGFLAAVGGLPATLLNAPWAPGAMTSADGPTSGASAPLAFEAFLPVLQRASLLSAEDLQNPELADAHVRRNAVRSLAQVLVRIDPGAPSVTPAWYTTVMEGTVLQALQDYATDKRGDVGSFVRLAVLEGLPSLLTYGLTAAAAVPLCTAATKMRVLQGVVRCVLEKLDRVRAVAGGVLARVLLDDPCDKALWAEGTDKDVGLSNYELSIKAEVALFRAHLRRLVTHVTGEDSDAGGERGEPLAWNNTQQVISCIGPFVLIHCPVSLAHAAMEGLVVAAGDLSEHVRRPAAAALLSAFHGDHATSAEASATLPQRLSACLMDVLVAHEHEERMLKPASRVLDLLINESVFAVEQHRAVLEMLRKELKHFALNIIVLLAMVPLLTNVCRSPDVEVRRGAWALALTMIASRYPKVRAKVASDLYASLLVLTSGALAPAGLPLEGCRRAMAHLMLVQWDGSDAARTRAARNELYDMLEIDPPAARAANAGESANEDAQRGSMQPARSLRGAVAATYKSLVQETGY
ncbi:tubulin folding cofactor D, putative [Leishmania donovani]|uniref:Tubulin folding cofactor D, putative n=2 Tax=Leishmania donovani TaxID=5661 RepID=E9BH72_LEIDO|nr:tubulin folding cofactor D, putative [Leishmania donovani]CBZ34598.1 tubulin folding cofactor D, putative [Leishmania donovani]